MPQAMFTVAGGSPGAKCRLVLLGLAAVSDRDSVDRVWSEHR